MIGKTISTFDNVLPVENPDKLRAIWDELRKRPNPADLVDFSEEREALDRLTALLNGKREQVQR
jgi:hypothetical protein